MKALVIYDSQYGNTAQIARAIADGLKSAATNTIEVDLQACCSKASWNGRRSGHDKS